MNIATFDFEAHLARQAAFSAVTFGPGARTEGICDHIRKELVEVAAAPGDLKEWIDVAILALDGAWRCGATPAQIIEALVAKQSKNEGRAWPDWRIADPAKAIEHDRSGELGADECWAVNEEEFKYSSLGELIDSNDDLEVGFIVWRGEARVPAAARLIDSDDVLETMGDRASDIAGEFADGYPDATTEARAELDSMLSKWIGKWCPPAFYEVENVKPYTLTADDLSHQEAA